MTCQHAHSLQWREGMQGGHLAPLVPTGDLGDASGHMAAWDVGTVMGEGGLRVGEECVCWGGGLRAMRGGRGAAVPDAPVRARSYTHSNELEVQKMLSDTIAYPQLS